ncbi:hypothetical protein INR49_032366 [Caranx melampygus]|nr:hypothetical protein INR49_032366 [Caranx melampygus]
MTTDSSLLNSELELQQQEELYQQLLLQTMGNMQTDNPDYKVIKPQPGMCVKTVLEPDKQKVFINICQSNSVPPPPELSRQELVDLLQSEDPSGYRVPMSLGEPHTEVDNSSQGCTAYDVVINQEFFQRCQNRKFMGSVSEQNIRTKSRPVIEELSPQPEFSLFVEPPAGVPKHLIAEINLPGVPSSSSLVLDVGEDRLVLTARPSLFELDIFHPFLINQENTVAQYNKSTEILTVTMPVVSS